MKNENVSHVCISTNRVKQYSVYIFSIAVLQAWSTELTFGPHTNPTATYCLGIQSLLSALVTRAALNEQHTQTHTHTRTVKNLHTSPRKPGRLVHH